MPVADGVAARTGRLRRRGRHARPRPALRAVGRGGARRARARWCGCSPACTTTTATSRSPASARGDSGRRRLLRRAGARASPACSTACREIGSGSVPQRLWAKPAITVIGIDTTSIAKSSNTLIPRARAKVSMRVAPGGDARRAPGRADAATSSSTRHGARRSPSRPATWGSRTRSTPAGRSTTPPAPRFGRRGATSPSTLGVGGSIPFIAEFAAAFPSAKILVTGVEDPQTQAHSINESLHLGRAGTRGYRRGAAAGEPGSDGQVAP